MRWKISPQLHVRHLRVRPEATPASKRQHDPRTMDLLAIVALLALVLGSGWYLATSLATAPATTAFIVPSQSVHW
ncbi:hypothetical protein JQ580_27610 [Bradyrhizobium japonicum]|uniref:hypothetical protein n=1 Tax=Bradyrhizobium japonicum TaxID=375 RepID=UPI001BAD3B0B|nr:hypothetical protein [Bradyrhizobium japonicum]MBR0994490.1 hypothetical protein [Bradyrhizobium japonicum]